MNSHYDIKKIYEWPVKMRMLVVAVVAIIVFFFGYFLDLSSANTKLDKGEEQEADLKQQLESIFKKKAAAQNEIAQLPQLRTALTAWREKLAKHSQIPQLLSDILKAGTQHELYFTLFNPKDLIKEENYIKLPIETIIVGDYHHLSQFIQQLTQLPWLIVISDFIISNEIRNDVLGTKLAEKARENNLLTAEITLLIYYLPENDAHEKP